VLAGVTFCALTLGDPTLKYLARQDAVLSVRRRHLESFGREFEGLSQRLTTDHERLGAIVLAGHIGHVGMITEAGRLWRESEARIHLLPQAIWAQLRSPDSNADFTTIEEMFRLLLELPSEKADGAHISERGRVAEFLRLCNLDVGELLATWLVAIASRQHELRGIVWTLLARVDVPEAVETVARMAAAAEEAASARGGFSPAAAMVGDPWRRSGRRLGESSRRRLQGIWRDDEESESVRWKAFHLWTFGVDQQVDALDVLRAVNGASPLYAATVATRARLGDKSAEPAFATLLSKSLRRARLGSRVWGPQIATTVDALLKQWDDPSGCSDDSYNLADLLTLAPRDEARKLLADHWAKIRCIPRFVQAALTIGGDELEALVAAGIAEWPKDGPAPLEHAVSYLDIGHEDGLVAPVDEGTIARLLPYTSLLGEFDLERMGEATRKHGFPLWGREHVGPFLSDRSRARVFPTPTTLCEELDEMVRDTRARSIRGQRWVEVAEERCDGLYDVLSVLNSWLSNNRTEHALELAADAVVALGRRSGIDVLANHSDLCDASQRRRVEDVALLVRRRSLAEEPLETTRAM